MVWQHDPSRTDPDGFGSPGDVANDDRRGGAGDAGHVVVFRHPIAFVTPGFGLLGQFEGVVKGYFGGGTLRDGNQVKNREVGHGNSFSIKMNFNSGRREGKNNGGSFQPRSPK